MSKIFISHSSVNNAAALAVAKWLADTGWAEYFLDINPSRGLAPGERWQEALKSAADRCEAVLFLVSPAWQTSRWCLAEFLLAKQLGKTIFGVLVEATPLEALPREMTAEWQLCDLVTGTARSKFRVSQEPIVSDTEVSLADDGLLRLRIGLQRAGLDPSSFAWPPQTDPNRAPYRGLKALEPEDAAVFFGREAAIVRGLDALRSSRERGVERLFVILGASGAGKSSFLRAGLWPRLTRDDRHFLPLPVIRPERAVISGATGFAASLAAAFRLRKVARSRAAINQTLQEPGGFDLLLAELQALVNSPIEPDAPPPIVVIPIDQGEELFSADGGEEAERFLELVASALSPAAGEGAAAIAARQRSLAIVAIRSDSYERLQTAPQLAQVAPYLFSLPPIATAEFKAVVEGPARRHTEAGHKLTVDPALSERLVSETEGADALPLLAFTLERLFVEHGGAGKLLLEDYQTLGGVRGSIEAAVEAAFVEPGREPAVPADKAVRARLLRVGFIPWLARVDPETEEPKRRVVGWQEIPAEARPLLERLIEQRLLVRDRRKLEGREEVVVLEVAHEALLRQWPMLTSWLDEDLNALKVLDAAQRAASEWAKNRAEASGGDAWLVHTGERLVAAEALRRRPDFERLLGADGQAYLDACRARDERARREREGRAEADRIAKERELEQAKALAEAQRQRADEQSVARLRQRRFAWALSALLVMALGAALYAWRERGAAEGRRQEAESQTRLALSRQLVAGSFLAFPAHLDQVLLLSLAARSVADTVQTRDTLLRALQHAPSRLSFLWGNAGNVHSVAFSPDSKLLASGGEDQRVFLWDVATRQPLGEPLSGHQRAVSSVAFSPDGKLLASGGEDEQVILWDLATHKPLGEPLGGHRGEVSSVAFSPHGELLASGGADQSVILWNVATRKTLGEPLSRQRGAVWSVAFSPDGKLLASGGEDGSVILWDVATRKPLGDPLTGHHGPVRCVAFSPDGTLFASASDDKRVILWDMAHRKPLGEPFTGHQGPVYSIAFRADGKLLVSGGADKRVILWDVRFRQPLNGRAGEHQDVVRSVAFSPNGKFLASGGQDKQVILWDAATRGPAVMTFGSTQFAEINMVADGKVVATKGYQQGGPMLYEVGRTLLSEPLAGHEGRVSSVAFSSDGKMLASGGEDKRVLLWDVATRKPLGEPLAGHQGGVSSVAFSPDGKLLASGDQHAHVILWDAATRKALGEPLMGDQFSISSVAFSPDSTILASAGQDGRIILWDVFTRKAAGEPLSGHEGAVVGINFSPDGKLLASGGEDKRVILWDLATRKPVGAPLIELKQKVSCLSFSPDGKLLAVGGEDKQVILLNVATRKLVGEPLSGHQGAVSSVTFSPDSRLLASGGRDKRVILWDVATRKPLGEPLSEHQSIVSSVAFSPDGKLVASGTQDDDNVVVLWNVDIANWGVLACAIANRNLTHREWAEDIGNVMKYIPVCSDLPVPAE